jgi:hypothetical protein
MCLAQEQQIDAKTENGDVFVIASAKHRADWIVAQLPPTAEDLSLLVVEKS